VVKIKDKDLYAIAGQEVANGIIDTGLWTKAFSDSGGNDAQAKALYLKMRVIDISSQRNAQQQQARIEQQRNIVQQKQQARYAKQQEAILEDAKRNARPWFLKLFESITGVLVLVFLGWLWIGRPSTLQEWNYFCCTSPNERAAQKAAQETIGDSSRSKGLNLRDKVKP